MKKPWCPLRSTVLIFLIVLSTCIFTGCGNDKGSNDNKSSSASLKKMSSWPNDSPKFKNGKLFQVLNDADTGVLKAATFGQIKNPEAAYKNYKTALINSSWVFDVDSSNEYVCGGAYSKGSKSLQVSIQKDGSAAQIMYIDR